MFYVEYYQKLYIDSLREVGRAVLKGMLSSLFKSGEEKATELFTEYLKNLNTKYNEDFYIEKVFRRGERFIAEVRQNSTPSIRFEAFTNHKLEIVGNTYIDVQSSNRFDRTVEEIASKVFQSEILVMSEFETDRTSHLKEIKYTEISLNDYLISNPNVYIYTYIFIKCSSDVNVDVEARKIDRLADKLIDYGVKNVDGTVFYLNSKGYADIIKEDKFNFNDYNYWEKENAYNIAEMNVIDGEKVVEVSDKDYIDEVKQSFYFK